MPAVFGIESSGLDIAVRLTLALALVVWAALVYWTYADARRRIEDPPLIAIATAVSLVPFVGTLVYAIVRPPEYVDDVRERQLEIEEAEVRLRDLASRSCPQCGRAIEHDFLRCPACLRKLKDPCHACTRPLDPAWAICPYCEAEVPGAIQPQRAARTRRRREGPPPSLGEPTVEHEI